MTIDTKNLRTLAEAAPDGPWEYDPNSDSYSGAISNSRGFLIEGEFYGGTDVARYIAACSPDVLLALLDALERKDRVLNSMRENFKLIGKDYMGPEAMSSCCDLCIEAITKELTWPKK